MAIKSHILYSYVDSEAPANAHAVVRVAVVYAWLSAKKDRFLQTGMIAGCALEISE